MKTKLEKLEAAIASVPDEFGIPRNVMANLLASADLLALRAYSLGLRDMAICLTSEDSLIEPLSKIRELLKS